ncbi:MAG: hypothetical protein AB7I50_21860 [Vicinamibacterales bacterium]
MNITYLLPSPREPVIRSIDVPARARLTLWVNRDPALTDVDVSARLLSDRPIVAERAMYRDTPGGVLGAGHVSAGIAAPSTQWFLAEGATGSFFDLFVLIANPSDADATVDVTYLLPSGPPVEKTYRVGARTRFNLWVDAEDTRLHNTAVSTIVASTNGVPVVVERAMWWPGPTAATWMEAHAASAHSTTGRRWAVAEGEVGGQFHVDTFLLILNQGAADVVTVTLFFEDGSSVARPFNVQSGSRFDIAIGSDFAYETKDKRFSAVVEAANPSATLVVDWAMYSDANGVIWASGSSAAAKRLE